MTRRTTVVTNGARPWREEGTPSQLGGRGPHQRPCEGHTRGAVEAVTQPGPCGYLEKAGAGSLKGDLPQHQCNFPPEWRPLVFLPDSSFPRRGLSGMKMVGSSWPIEPCSPPQVRVEGVQAYLQPCHLLTFTKQILHDLLATSPHQPLVTLCSSSN